MKKYEVRCHGGDCGVTLGSVELPDDRPLTDQASGYYCQDCGQKLRTGVSPQGAAPSEQQALLEAFKTRVAGKDAVDPADLDELVSILFRK